MANSPSPPSTPRRLNVTNDDTNDDTPRPLRRSARDRIPNRDIHNLLPRMPPSLLPSTMNQLKIQETISLESTQTATTAHSTITAVRAAHFERLPLPNTREMEPSVLNPPVDALLRLPRCARPVEDSIKTLYHLTRTSFPPNPPIYDHKALQGTKRMSTTERDLTSEQVLQQIVFFPGLVRQLHNNAKVALESVPIDWKNILHREAVTDIHPYHTRRQLPPTIYSEKDVERWIFQAILQPVIAMILAVRSGDIGKLTLGAEFPYISSAPSTGVIADGIFVESGWYPEHNVKGTMEAKVHTVWKKMNGQDVLDDLQRLPSGYQQGTAIRFNWPSALDVGDVQTKMLVQVWTQMVSNDCNTAMLSSYSYTVFFYRKDQTMYMSPTYTQDDNILFFAYSWLAVALGELPGFSQQDLEDSLPTPLTDWWTQEVKNNEVPGAVPMSIPLIYENSLKQAQEKRPLRPVKR